MVRWCQELTARYDPSKAGLLVPDVVVQPERAANKRQRLSDRSGSMTMQQIKEVRRERDAQEKEEADRIAAGKAERERKKAVKMTAAMEAQQGFEACEVVCVCGIVPCPYAKWKRCPQCGPKSGVCKVRVCVEKRKPLLLTMEPAAAQLLLTFNPAVLP